jgi:hypothetical protein
LTLLGVAERLLAWAAITGVIIYVLLNWLYVQFYGNFGVRPEQVGLDRLAVIGRSGMLAAIALFPCRCGRVGRRGGGLLAQRGPHRSGRGQAGRRAGA